MILATEKEIKGGNVIQLFKVNYWTRHGKIFKILSKLYQLITVTLLFPRKGKTLLLKLQEQNYDQDYNWSIVLIQYISRHLVLFRNNQQLISGLICASCAHKT